MPGGQSNEKREYAPLLATHLTNLRQFVASANIPSEVQSFPVPEPLPLPLFVAGVVLVASSGLRVEGVAG